MPATSGQWGRLRTYSAGELLLVNSSESVIEFCKIDPYQLEAASCRQDSDGRQVGGVCPRLPPQREEAHPWRPGIKSLKQIQGIKIFC